MLLLSARAGALAEGIGPRLPMTVGPLVCAVALLLLARTGAGASYARDVLPGVAILGLGLSLTVAPLTATALGSVEPRHAGIASGVNNAVARAASLLAVAALPLAAGLGDGSLTDPGVLAPIFRRSMWICAGLLAAGGAMAFATIPALAPHAAPRGPGRAAPELAGPPRERPVRVHCAVAGPPLHPRVK
jgi:hypothetical protein